MDTIISSFSLVVVLLPIHHDVIWLIERTQPNSNARLSRHDPPVAMKSLKHIDRIRMGHLLRVCVGGVAALLLWTFMNTPSCHEDDSDCHRLQYFGKSNTRRETPLETSVLAHAPGFTVIENAYWKNHTWYLISSKTWAFPEPRLLITNGPWHGQDIKWDESVIQILTWQQAKERGLNLYDVETVEGSSILFNDRIYLGHFYHLVGEIFMGIWAAYTSVLGDPFYDASSSKQHSISESKPVVDRLPEITKLIFAHVPPTDVYDHAGLSQFFFNNAFPKAQWEFQDDWDARADSLKVYRFDRITIGDRKSGHMGGGFGKPMDRAFELPVPARWVGDLKQRLLQNYRGPVSLKDPGHAHSKPVITYLSRQTAAHRRLKEDVHDALIAGLKSLEEEGIAEVNIEEFTDADPKDEQVAKLSRTTIFVSLHGNGLTNLIWMTPDRQGRSTVYEIQRKGMFMDDYAVLSEVLGISHWIIGGRSETTEYCQRRTCGVRGTDAGIAVGSKDYTIEVPVLLSHIRQGLSLAR